MRVCIIATWDVANSDNAVGVIKDFAALIIISDLDGYAALFYCKIWGMLLDDPMRTANIEGFIDETTLKRKKTWSN
jgi:hypothetical protein